MALDEATIASVRADAVQLAARFTAERIRVRSAGRWQYMVPDWDAIERVFDALRSALGMRGDLSRGVLRSTGWKPTLRLRETLAGLPAFADLIRVLGRLRESDDPNAPSMLERIGGPIMRVIERQVTKPSAGSIEIRGLERSDEIARMLPSEAALLSRPKLRRLWIARFADRALLTYHAEGVYTRRIQTVQGFDDGAATSHRRAERGPIVVVFDTSGSMAGAPEQLAKAVVLQILCCAHEEKRRCLLYNFSGPGEVDWHEIGFDGDALPAALLFLSKSFGGGTDPREPMRLAIRQLQEENWRHADVVIITDGGFYGTDATTVAEAKKATRERGTRFHGVVIGTEATPEIIAICDPVHLIGDWLRRVRD